MDWLFPVAVIILAAIIQATLQLSLGTQLLLYHASLGKHVRKKTRSLVSSFISGAGIVTLLAICTVCFILMRIFGGPMSVVGVIVVACVLMALAIAIWFFYYRGKKKSTELWIPKIVADFIDERANVTEINTEAFSLGILTILTEIPFSVALLVAAGNSILALDFGWQLIMVAVYTIIAIIPLLVLRFRVRRGTTVVEAQKWRQKNKNFLKIMSGVGFMVLGIVLIVFIVL